MLAVLSSVLMNCSDRVRATASAPARLAFVCLAVGGGPPPPFVMSLSVKTCKRAFFFFLSLSSQDARRQLARLPRLCGAWCAAGPLATLARRRPGARGEVKHLLGPGRDGPATPPSHTMKHPSSGPWPALALLLVCTSAAEAGTPTGSSCAFWCTRTASRAHD